MLTAFFRSGRGQRHPHAKSARAESAIEPFSELIITGPIIYCSEKNVKNFVCSRSDAKTKLERLFCHCDVIVGYFLYVWVWFALFLLNLFRIGRSLKVWFDYATVWPLTTAPRLVPTWTNCPLHLHNVRNRSYVPLSWHVSSPRRSQRVLAEMLIGRSDKDKFVTDDVRRRLKAVDASREIGFYR